MPDPEPPDIKPLALSAPGTIQSTKPDLAPEEAVVVGMFDPTGVGAAFISSGWDLRTEVEMLAGIAKDDENKPGDRISAAKQLRSIVHESIDMHSAVTSEEATFDSGDGRSLRLVRRTTNLLSRMREAKNDQPSDFPHGEIFAPRLTAAREESPVAPEESKAEGTGSTGG